MQLCCNGFGNDGEASIVLIDGAHQPACAYALLQAIHACPSGAVFLHLADSGANVLGQDAVSHGVLRL